MFINYNIGNILETSILNVRYLHNINRLSKYKRKQLENRLILLEKIEGLIPLVVIKDEPMIFVINCKEKRSDIICMNSLTNIQTNKIFKSLNL